MVLNVATISRATVGRVTAGEKEVTIYPRDNSHVGRRGVIYAHGFGADAMRFCNNYQQTLFAVTIAKAGLAVCAADFGGDTMGNNAAANGVNNAWTLLKSMGCATDKVLLVGNSMGHGTCCAFTRVYGKDKVAAVVGVSPMTQLTPAYSGAAEAQVPGSQAAAQTAWGVTYPTPLPAGADPLLDPTTHAGIPRRLYSSLNDPTVLWADVGNFAAAVAGTTRIQAGTQAAHSDPVMADIDLVAAAAWLKSFATP